MRILKTIGRYSAVATLLATAVQSAYADQGINYTWVEGGVSRVTSSVNGKSFNMDGGYLRGSFAIGDNFYLLGGYSQNSGNWKRTRQQTIEGINGTWPFEEPYTDYITETTKAKEKLAQSELGLGLHIALPGLERVDAIGELVGMHWKQEGQLTETGGGTRTNHPTWWRGRTTQQLASNYSKVSSTDRVWGGKALVGFRAQPFNAMEFWAKGGYLKMEQKLADTVVGNLGVQFRITDNFGIVGEADFYEKDANQYRIGARVSF